MNRAPRKGPTGPRPGPRSSVPASLTAPTYLAGPSPASWPSPSARAIYLRVQTEELDRAIHEHHSATVAGSHNWASHQVSAPVPEGAIFLQFGVTLNGRGRIELRNASLIRRH